MTTIDSPQEAYDGTHAFYDKDAGRTKVTGKELFYLAPDHKLMAVGIKTGAAFEAEAPRPLFETRIRDDPDRHFDVSADGKSFLVRTVPAQSSSGEPLTVVQNWTTALKK